MDSFSVTGHIRWTVVLVGTEASQTGSISIGYFDVIKLTGMLNLKIWGEGSLTSVTYGGDPTCEVNVDDFALCNLDGLPLMKLAGIVVGKVGRFHLSTCCSGFGLVG